MASGWHYFDAETFSEWAATTDLVTPQYLSIDFGKAAPFAFDYSGMLGSTLTVSFHRDPPPIYGSQQRGKPWRPSHSRWAGLSPLHGQPIVRG